MCEELQECAKKCKKTLPLTAQTQTGEDCGAHAVLPPPPSIDTAMGVQEKRGQGPTLLKTAPINMGLLLSAHSKLLCTLGFNHQAFDK